MKTMFYPKLAIESMRKNKRHYLPYFMSCTLMICIFYIIVFLSDSEMVRDMPGGGATQQILSIGGFVIAIFSAIFLFYTNSFLIRMRKKEFGLYNILGMSKKNLGIVLFWETLITYVVTMVFGLFFGVVLSKFSELVLLNLVRYEVNYRLYVWKTGISVTVVVFSVIFFLILLNSLRQIWFSNAVDLVKSEKTGEKPPKGNVLIGIAGILILGGAYYIAVTIKHPLAALVWFFIAVVMVIIGTYMIFIAGSVLLCKILQKNKKYYYKKNHFVAVSSMAYRMKRNGAGLASICILLTMVLVMISASASLYFGAEDCLKLEYPKDLNILISHDTYFSDEREMAETLQQRTEQIVSKEEQIKDTVKTYYEGILYGTQQIIDGNLHLNLDSDQDMMNYDYLAAIHFLDIRDYNRVTGSAYELSEGEALTCCTRTQKFNDKIVIGEKEYRSVGTVSADTLKEIGTIGVSITADIILIVPDADEELAYYQTLAGSESLPGDILVRWNYLFDTMANQDRQKEICKNVKDALITYMTEESGHPVENLMSVYCDSRDLNRMDFYGSFGGILFIGILMSIVFLVAAVLIIYYKQISEGFEDQSRFAIMQKVGMTKKDIRATINAQMLIVFLMPILFAAMHTMFAFPVVNKLLMLFGFLNVKLFLQINMICILICGLFYLVVYRLTSNSYYSIVV